jgi:tetratricopeptide (TPR) repeat protein
MLDDRFGNPLSTSSTAARDAYVEGCNLQLAAWAGAGDAFARAAAEDPGFALAHVGVAIVAAGRGDVAGIQSALAAAHAATAVSEREASHVAFYGLMLSGKLPEATVAGRIHLGAWPLDGMVMSNYASIVGLLGFSGRPGMKREQELAFDYFAPHWGEEWWYLAQHSMALLEVGRLDEAEARNERALAINPRNGWGAHSRGHIAYERGDYASARPYMRGFLAGMPNAGPFYSHLAWHLALADLHAGDSEAA